MDDDDDHGRAAEGHRGRGDHGGDGDDGHHLRATSRKPKFWSFEGKPESTKEKFINYFKWLFTSLSLIEVFDKA